MKEKMLIMVVLAVMSVNVIAVPIADIYVPFENSNGTSGPGSEANPGWQNVGSAGDQSPYVIGPAADAYPVIATPAIDAGIKGDYEDMLTVGGWGNTMGGTHYNGATADVLEGAMSFTTTMWVKSGWNVGADNDHHYLFEQGSGTVSLRYRTDAKVFMQYNGVWKGGTINGAGGAVPSNGEWVFIAASVDSVNNRIIFFSGSKTQPVTVLGGIDTTAIDALPATMGAFNLNMWGDETQAAVALPGLDMDEFRIFASDTDASGALSLSDIESIRQYDLEPIPEPATMSLLGLGAFALIRRRK